MRIKIHKFTTAGEDVIHSPVVEASFDLRSLDGQHFTVKSCHLTGTGTGNVGHSEANGCRCALKCSVVRLFRCASGWEVLLSRSVTQVRSQ